MRIIVCGCDGYIGTPLTHRLLKQGHDVLGIDNYFRRACNLDAVINTPMDWNIEQFEYEGQFKLRIIDIAKNFYGLEKAITDFYPECIVNLAHQPSAPFSMQSMLCAKDTLENNIMGTHNLAWVVKNRCRLCPIVTIGSTGEYDHYSNIPIKEGYFQTTVDGRLSDELMYPRRPGSIYHASKTASTILNDLYARTWGLRITDIMQSIVFGLWTDEAGDGKTLTRFDVDECFGTVVNRFIAQTVAGLPMTVYGNGQHKRGFIGLNDSIQGLMIAINNPPKSGGRPQVWNQLSETHSINEVARMVKKAANELGMPAKIHHIDTPRTERTTDHFYEYETKILEKMGYHPWVDMYSEIEFCLKYISEYGKFSNTLLRSLSDPPRIEWKR